MVKMMGENNTKQILVLVIVIAFALGCFGGTWLIQRNYEGKLENVDEKIGVLNDSIAMIDDNILSMAISLENLDDRFIDLNQLSHSNEYLVSSVADQLDYLSHRFDLLEEELKLETKANQENVKTIDELEAHIKNLYLELGVGEDNKLYVDNELKFEYPGSMNVSDSGLRIGDASDKSGIVYMNSYADNISLVILATWEYNFFDNDIEGIFSDSSSNREDLRDIGFREITLSEIKNMNMNGHTMYYNEFMATYETLNSSGIYGGWYCPQNKRIHSILAYALKSSEMTTFYEETTSSFRCHS